ncbi:hypothetical protein N8E89_05575 [Phyllobacterium sp. A18/5-2]|uniref:hypothetical protein n=1 Tax=Phyllobacterium sp. A18/5-2 TaxID=2978392 RepID=UPI0013AF8AB9|nr:hypothetical protein [Phyllobacterium sp. A18/5-2]UXN65167.1 hypothetical protein N8E89_05575 [Phyllobacterium sp. A18/5-2]
MTAFTTFITAISAVALTADSLLAACPEIAGSVKKEVQKSLSNDPCASEELY